jgi:hypothetical protein
MSQELATSPPFSSLAVLGAKLYSSKRILLETDTLVIFTCGAATGVTQSAREQLLDYADRYFLHGTFFRAEDAFHVLLKSETNDYLTIEHQLADYADCVVIINESAGTLAELGAFASNDGIVKKLLVVNPREHKGRPSFINLGPIAKTDRQSLFKTTIYVDLPLASLSFDEILIRIEANAVKRRRQGVDFSDPQAWGKAPGKLRLLLLQDVLNLFCPLSESELLRVMKTCFPHEYVKLGVELGLLVATHKALEVGDLIVTTRACSRHNYAVDFHEWLRLRKKILDLYRSCDPSRLDHLHRRSAEVS